MNTFGLRKHVENVRRRGLSLSRTGELSEVEEAGCDALMETFGLRLRAETVERLGPLGALVKALVRSFMKGEGTVYRPKGFEGFLIVHKLMKDFLEGVAWL